MRCELAASVARADLEAARRQHAAYEQALKDAGCSLVRLAAGDEMPDSVFIEDIAVVFGEVAIITHPGAESRRGETTAVAEALAPYRPLLYIEAPGRWTGATCSRSASASSSATRGEPTARRFRKWPVISALLHCAPGAGAGTSTPEVA